jgi:hypothetical protein
LACIPPISRAERDANKIEHEKRSVVRKDGIISKTKHQTFAESRTRNRFAPVEGGTTR